MADGPPVVYAALGHTSGFQPWRPRTPDRLLLHPHREMPPAIDKLERFLALVFLRRYITYYTRHRRFVQAQGAANLHHEIASG